MLGFNEHTCYDPFFPSSPDEEHLIPIGNQHSSDPRACQSPSPAAGVTPNGFPGPQLSPSPATGLNAHLPPHHSNVPASNGFHVTALRWDTDELGGHASAAVYDFPAVTGFQLDQPFPEPSESSVPPNFDDLFMLEQRLVNDPEQADKPTFSLGLLDSALPDPIAAQPHPAKDSARTQKPWAGAANLSSHLMSPVLTETTSPGSQDDGGSPPGPHRPTAHDAHTAAEGGAGGTDEDATRTSGPLQHTPALTGSSMGTSPDRSYVPPIAGAASPLVRIETYSRGDSPARPARPMVRSGSQRSRASAASYLAVRHDGDSEEDDADHDEAAGRASPRAAAMLMPLGMYDDDDPAMAAEGRTGLDPQARMPLGGAEVPNLKEQEETAQIALKNADVEEWLARSEAGSAGEGPSESSLLAPPRPTGIGRRRAKSTGDTHLSHANLMRLRAEPARVAPDSHIPGPGLLINEDSVADESESADEEAGGEGEDREAQAGMPVETAAGAGGLGGDDGPQMPESPPAVIEVEDLSSERMAHIPGEAPPPPALYRARLWQDPLYDSTDPGTRIQPVTSNDAMMRFQQRAGDIETVSRVATWGTRRMSESDLEGLFHGFSFSDEKDRSKPKGERRGSFLEQAAAKFLPKHNIGTLRKRKESETARPSTPRASAVEQAKRDSVGSRKESVGGRVEGLDSRKGSLEVPRVLQRKPSLSKTPKSPKINTGSAVAAMVNQFAAVGASGPVGASGLGSPTSPWASAKNVLKRSRSRSDVHIDPPPSSSNLGHLWTRQGGPPMPALVSPAPAKGDPPHPEPLGDLDDDDDDDVMEEKGVTIDFSIQADPIVPTRDGFKANVRQLNPRLPPFLVDRIAQEQLRRYKKLVDFKIKHLQATSVRKCPSEKHCVELGGEPTYLPSKASGREPEHSHTGFSITGPAPSDDDVNALAEGIVTPAQFPLGVPMPPVKRLPAEFECSLCFKVKRFSKPSDWSKHVHEDVQPFTCTFPTCADPKSFKRKADWVRHENERHRQLEWWQCNMNDCTHKCYRKDNFVQHLVREHKLPEPRLKTARASKPAVRGPSSQKRKTLGDDHSPGEDSPDEIDQVWRLVEECRHETLKNPQEEPCKFCGNVCNGWKKLTVHLAKHMEQISMPVLTVVKHEDVTPETIISPIEQRVPPQSSASTSPIVQSAYSQTTCHVSPFGRPGVETVEEVPAPFPSLHGQPSYHVDTAPHQGHGVPGTYRRNSPSNYSPPVPSPHPPQPYSRFNSSSYHLPGYHQPEAAIQYSPVVPASRGFPHTAPDTLYSNFRAPHMSQPRSAPYPKEDTYPSAYPPHPYSHAIDTPTYAYRGRAASAYQPAPLQVQMQYGSISEMQYSQAQTDPAVYVQHLQQPQQQQQQHQQHQQGQPGPGTGMNITRK